ncbi:MAG: AAA family ATPase [Chloroflexi bacterium]|nr:AAA family ATPase [Chloroflexota bacterium]
MNRESATLLSPEKRHEFSLLFQEFVQTYLPTPAGQQRLAQYSRGRELARTNFALITAAAARGHDVTDRVLLQFLPYVDSTNNRQKGAWIHVAPAINGDIRKWYEAKRWAKRRSWPAIATAILRFIQQCERDPETLTEACTAFVRLPYTKGFQTGTLTPILNALQPDNFGLITNKSRRVLNYFTNATFAQTLNDYPAANATLLRLRQTLTDLLAPATPTQARTDDLFDLFCQWLVSVKKYAFRNVRYWLIALGEQGWQWDEWREGGFVALGWDEVGDLTGLSRAEFMARRDELLKEQHDWTKRTVNQIWTFARQIKEGDRIVAQAGPTTEDVTTIFGIGIVAGAYYFVPGVQNGHCLPVEWDDTTQRQVNLDQQHKLLSQLSRQQFEDVLAAPVTETEQTYEPPTKPTIPILHETAAIYAEKIEHDSLSRASIIADATTTPVSWPVNPTYSLAECVQDTGFEQEILEHWVAAIRRKGQAIIYGPPGVGKTFLADHLARHLIGGDDGLMEMVQFHPSYAYEDFVQGIRPKTSYGQLAYAMVPGRFLEFCRQAEQRHGPCVLIIDEINRANLARVFGELMVLLEYRAKQIPLAGGDEPFGIPPNVYLIGTMNTADRSIALVDHALRRRFAFLALYPNYAALRTFHAREQTNFPVEPLISLLQQLNLQIGDRHYEIGISYFMRQTLAQEIQDIWQMEIEPYLEEYFFDNVERMEEFRWARVARELFNAKH